CLTEDLPGQTVNAISTEDTWFINGRALPGEELKKILRSKTPSERVYFSADGVVAAFVKAPRAAQAADSLRKSSSSSQSIDGFSASELDCTLVKYTWDLIEHIGAEIVKAFDHLSGSGKGKSFPRRIPAITGVHFLNARRILSGKNPRIHPGVVLDAD